MEKPRAFLIHLSISVIVFLPFLYVICFIWYPSPLLEMEGGKQILVLLIVSTIISGPLLTWIIYKPGKKGLVFDLIFIPIVQIMALLYGVYILYLERPQYIAFNVDRFSLIPAASINIDELQDKSLETSWLDKPVFVYIEMPEDSIKRMEITVETLSGGKDFIQRPEFFRPFQKFSTEIISDSHQLSLKQILQSYPDLEKQIDKLARNHNMSVDEFVFYPFQGKQNDRIIVLKKNNAKQVSILNIDPWNIKS